ncbi:DUF4838 domain-containing protein [Microlunatus sp. GCM10028923]|uniref:DUF4838 domain-containing protein n=1 Tax=Microlunatus sp. GCM10028923 TaxID=3273400 RepID=UPI00361E3E87
MSQPVPSVSRRHLLQLTATAGVGAAAWQHLPRPAAAAEPLIIADQGRSDYAVCVGSGESAAVKYVAAELVDLLRQVTGAEVPVLEIPAKEGTSAPGPDSHRLIVGTQNPYAADFGPITGLGDDGYTTRRHRHDLLVAGTSDLGTLHGVYALIEGVLGVRWLTATETVVPRRTGRVAVPGSLLDTDSVPRFRFRHCHYGEARPAMFRHHRQLNGRRDWFDAPVPPGLDLWSSYWPEEKYLFFRDLVDDAALRQDDNIKFMSREARDQAVPKVVAFLKDRIAAGDDPVVGLIQWDRGTWQPDPDSRAFNEAHGGAAGAAMFDFVNEVAERVAKIIPEARLETEAYVWSIAPPTGMRIRDNVVITVCPIWAVRGQSLFHPANELQTGYLRGWAKLADNLVLWDYQTSFQSYLEPFPQWFDGFETIKELASIEQFQGVFVQGPWNTAGAEMGPLRVWVHSRLLRDPSLDTGELVDEFLAAYFGDAAESVRTYLDLLWHRKNELEDPLPEGGRVQTPLFDYPTVRAADQALARAEKAVRRDAALLRRVQIARFNLDYVIFMRAAGYREDARRAGETWDLDLVRRKQRSQAALKASGFSKINEGGGDPQFLVDNYYTGEPVPAAPPAAVDGLDPDQWHDFQEEAFTIWPLMTTIADDPDASDHRCARMDPRGSEWGVQVRLNRLPEGASWRLFVSLRIEAVTAPHTDVAANLGVYPPFGVEAPVKIGDLADRRYHEIELPGSYQRDDEQFLFVHNITNSTAIRVDRVFAVKIEE